MDDYSILNEERKVYFIGPKRKKIELEMLGISKYYEVFIPRFLDFLEFFKADLELVNFPSGKDWNRKKDMEMLKSQLRRVLSLKKSRKQFISLLKKVGYLKFSKRYFNKYVKPVILVEILLRVYKFNIDDFKKKLSEKEITELFTSLRSRTYTGTSSNRDISSRSSGGVGLKKKLKSRYRQLKKSKSPS
jgi:hypothetical protein